MNDTRRGPSLRIATFNVSMEGGNYVQAGRSPSGHELPAALSNSDHPQIRNIAEIIQRVRPDIVLLNEFDYHPDPERGVYPFLRRYLEQGQPGAEAISYPHFFQGSVNTGVVRPTSSANQPACCGVPLPTITSSAPAS